LICSGLGVSLGEGGGSVKEGGEDVIHLGHLMHHIKGH